MSAPAGVDDASRGSAPSSGRGPGPGRVGRRGREATAAQPQAAATGSLGLAGPPKLRRRPAFLALGLLAVTVGALLATWLVTSVGDTRAVLAVRNDVDRGEVITADDLMTVSISLDPALRAVPAEQRDAVVGKRSTVDLPAGGLVVDGSFAAAPLPVQGQSLVGVWLATGQLPGQPLRSGDRVRVVATPRQQEQAPEKPPAAIGATVVSTQQSPDGHSLVTVSVPSSIAAQLSAMVATNRIALVLDSAAR